MEETNAPVIETPTVSTPVDVDAERKQVKALLAEARNTKDVLVCFENAVQGGTFHGSKMLDIAKGLSFLQAIINQNSQHIDNLQKRLETK